MNRALQAQQERLQKKYDASIAAADAILATLNEEDRTYTDEEWSAHQAHVADAKKYQAQIDLLDEQSDLSGPPPSVAASHDPVVPDFGKPNSTGTKETNQKGRVTTTGVPNAIGELQAEGLKFLTETYGAMDRSDPENPRPWAEETQLKASSVYGRAWMHTMVGLTYTDYHSAEQRNAIMAVLQSDNPTRVGLLTAPIQVVEGMLKTLDQENVVRQRASTFRTQADKLGITKRTGRTSSFTWGPELDDTANNRDTSLAVGKRELEPHYYSGEMEISVDAIRRGLISVEDFAEEEFSIEVGEGTEDAFINGDGVRKPLGLLTPSADGITTARDKTFTVASDVFNNFDDFIKAEHMVYRYLSRPGMEWLVSLLALQGMRLVKDGDSRYIWSDQEVQGGVFSRRTTTGQTVTVAEGIAPSLASSAYFGILGDLKQYWIVDSLDLQFQTLREVEARKNKVVLIYRGKVDAMPMLEEAFVRLQVA